MLLMGVTDLDSVGRDRRAVWWRLPGVFHGTFVPWSASGAALFSPAKAA